MPKKRKHLYDDFKTEWQPLEYEKPAKKAGKRVVALIGSAPSTQHLIPWANIDIEIWGLGWRQHKRHNRLFDLHKGNLDPGAKNVPPDYALYLKQCGCEVFLCEADSRVPMSVAYPLQRILQFLGPELDPRADSKYFVSTCAYMLALAIYEEVDEIQMYGYDFTTDSEYSHQRPNIEYLIGVARGKGVSVYIPPGCALLEYSYLYGYERRPWVGFITPELIDERQKQYNQKKEKLLAELHTLDGALQEGKQIIDLIRYQERGGKVQT